MQNNVGTSSTNSDSNEQFKKKSRSKLPNNHLKYFFIMTIAFLSLREQHFKINLVFHDLKIKVLYLHLWFHEEP